MATITTNQTLDSAARSAGEVMTINGGVLTIDTDTRWHANAPASMTGTLGSPTISATLGGGLTVDATAVRWLSYDTGSGNVPAIGTSITQGGVTGVLLGVYDSLTAVPTAVGAAVPADGFIKFKSVTGGAFAAGALTGIGANALGADVTGWLEVVLDQATAITTSRVGSGFVTRGGWFYLDDTTGSAEQILQVPTHGSEGTMCPGVWVESEAGSNEYLFWPALHAPTNLTGGNGWLKAALGTAEGETDFRQSFVKALPNGQMQIGQTVTQASTYASVSQASTYTTTAGSSTYTWVGGVIKVTLAGHGHFAGEQVYIDFTSGGATANDGLHTIARVTGPNTYEIDLVGSGAAGNCSVIKVITVTFTAHGLSVGEDVYLDFTTGAGVDGIYTVYSVTGANSYTVLSPQAATSGNATAVSRVTVTETAHGLTVTGSAGAEVYLDVTTGALPVGVYEIRDQPTAIAANTYTIGAAVPPATSGNVTTKRTIGRVPSAGCKTRIGNVFLRQATTTDTSTYAATANVCTITETGHGHAIGDRIYHDFTTGTAPDGWYTVATVPSANSYTFDCVTANTSGNVTRKGGRNYNMPPHATVGTRPDFTTTGAGIIDCEYAYGDWYFLAGQPYQFRMVNSATFDTINVSECATPVELNGVGVGMYSNLDVNALALTTNLNGGTVTDCSFMRGNVPGTGDHAVLVSTCDGFDFLRTRMGIIRHDARSTGYAIQLTSSSNITVTECELHGHAAQATTCTDVSFIDTFYCDHLVGFTNSLALYAFNLGSKCSDILIDGLYLGQGLKQGEVDQPRCHPYSGLLNVTACDRVRVRNMGTPAAPICPPSGGGVYATASSVVSGGINSDVKIQNIAVGYQRSASPVTTVNSDKGFRVENVHGKFLSTRLASTYVNAALDTVEKGIRAGANNVAANASVYGAHFYDMFNRDEYGRVVLVANEPTALTADVVDVISGAPKFTSAPGLAMATAGDEITFTMPYYAQGHSGFLIGTVVAPIFTGTNPNNHDLYYKIDKNDGSGFNASWRNLSYKRAGAGGTNGTTTVTMTSTTGVEVGDYVVGTNIGQNAKVVSIDSGTNITVDVANVGTVSGVLSFHQLPNETISSSAGFKLSVRVVANTTSTTNVLNYLSIDTVTDLAAQISVSYPLDPVTATLSLTGLKTGTEVHVYRASDDVELAGTEATIGSTFSYNYEWTGSDIETYITVIKVGYQWIRYNGQMLGSAGLTLPVFQAIDRNYRNP